MCVVSFETYKIVEHYQGHVSDITETSLRKSFRNKFPRIIDTTL